MPKRKSDGLDDLLGKKPAEAATDKKRGEAAPSFDSKDDSAPAEAAQESENESLETGYLGNGRYRRKDGIVERLDVYVPPETAKALRVAAARRDDPNGTSVSEIVCTLVEKAGYK